MAFEVLITAEAFGDLDRIVAFIAANSSTHQARKWFASIVRAIQMLREMPGRCPHAPESDVLGRGVRLLLHGRGNRAFKIYFAIDYGPPPDGKVFVFHIRHWARQSLSADELAHLIDDLSEEENS